MSVGRFAYTPLLPYMRDATGLSTSAAGWIASSNYLGYVAGALSASWLCRSLGLRATVRLGLVAKYGHDGGDGRHDVVQWGWAILLAHRRRGQRMGDDRRVGAGAHGGG